MRRELLLGLGSVVTGFAIGCGSGGEHQDSKITPSPIPVGHRYSPAYQTPDSILKGSLETNKLSENIRSAWDSYSESLYSEEIKNPICLRWPIYGPIGSYFGDLRTQGEGAIYHNGIDIGNLTDYGDPVMASADGVVELVGKLDWGLGNFVVLKHGSDWQTVYGYFSKINVEENQTVVAGEVIGEVGATGYATGPHVHFETWYKGKLVDPLDFLANKIPECAN